MGYSMSDDEILTAASKIAEKRLKRISSPITSVELAKDETCLYLSHLIGHGHAEQFLALWLDNHHATIAVDILFSGTNNATNVYPREVVRRALDVNSAAVILAHNHPAGDVNPSEFDIAITNEMKKCMQVIDCRLLDNIIVAGNGITYSFAENNLI